MRITAMPKLGLLFKAISTPFIFTENQPAIPKIAANKEKKTFSQKPNSAFFLSNLLKQVDTLFKTKTLRYPI